MTVYGMTPEGFVRKTLEVIISEREDAWRNRFGQSIDVAPEGPIGQIIGIESEREALLWEAVEAAISSMDPDKAEGAAQDAVAAITGSIREKARASVVTAVFTGTPGTVLDAGRIASVTGTGSRFVSLLAATIVALSARATSTAYIVGQRIHSNGNAWQCIGAGTSSGSATPLVVPTVAPWTVTDGTVTWLWLGLGTGAVDVSMASESTGAIVAAATTLREIETPVTGWDGVCNVVDAVLGRDLEGTADFGERRERELVGRGGSIVESIRNAILGKDEDGNANVPGVIDCRVFQNTDYLTDADGMPPHSVEVAVYGGLEADIVRTLWNFGAAAGIRTHGNQTSTIVDSQGFTQTVKWSRPEMVPIWIAMTIKRDTRIFNDATGPDAARTKILAMGAEGSFGKNAVPHAIRSQAFLVPGVLNVPTCNVDDAITPVAENEIEISPRQIAEYATSRIAITLTSGTP